MRGGGTGTRVEGRPKEQESQINDTGGTRTHNQQVGRQSTSLSCHQATCISAQ